MIHAVSYFIFPLLQISLLTMAAVYELPKILRRCFFIATLIVTWILLYKYGCFLLIRRGIILYTAFFTLLSVAGYLVVKPRWQFIFAGIPLLVIGIIYTSAFNDHIYRGGMDGFAAIIRLYMIYPFALFYPLLAFFIRNTGVSDRAKGISLAAASVVGGIWGVAQSYGRDGFLADHPTSVFFVFITMMFFAAGLWLLRKETFAFSIRKMFLHVFIRKKR
jgi:hypothetical protein